MPSRVFFQEVKRFFKENFKIYSLFILIGILTFGAMLFLNGLTDDNDKNSITIEEDARMATFVFYVENMDQEVYTNSNFLDTIFLSKKYVEGAESKTGVNLSQLIEEQLNSDFVPTLLDRGYIGVGRSVHNETMLFQAKLGSEEENLAVANYYYELIQNEEIPFLENKKVYVVREPYLVEMAAENVAATNEISSSTSTLVNVLKGFIFALVGLFIGLIFTFVYHLLTNKINYAFAYEFDDSDVFFLIRQDREEFVSALENPDFGQKLIISQETLPDGIKNELTKDNNEKFHFTNELLLENPDQDFSEVVFVIVENKTDKVWYYKQREVLKNFSNRIKILQVPSDLINE